MKKYLFSLFFLLLSLCSFAQGSLQFVVINGSNVNIRKAPSTSAPILTYMDGDGFETEMSWATKFKPHQVPWYFSKGTVLQVVARQNGWTKISFYADWGLVDKVAKGRDSRIIEGWMSDKFLKPIKPINLTWQNYATYIDKKWEYMANSGKVKEVLFIVGSIEGNEWISYGNVKNGHVYVYGESEEPVLDNSLNQKDLTFEKGSNGKVNRIIAGTDYFDNNSYDYHYNKFSAQQWETIYNAISKKLFYEYYVFNVGSAASPDAPNSFSRCVIRK